MIYIEICKRRESDVRIGEAVKNRIMELCDERNITINKLATICGITQSTLNNIVSGRNNSVTVATIQKICDGLNISIIEFFMSPAFDKLEQEIRYKLSVQLLRCNESLFVQNKNRDEKSPLFSLL